MSFEEWATNTDNGRCSYAECVIIFVGWEKTLNAFIKREYVLKFRISVTAFSDPD